MKRKNHNTLGLIACFMIFILKSSSLTLTMNRNPSSTRQIRQKRNTKDQKIYKYFAYGSNMALSTMTNLREIEPISYTPAILPNHELIFNVPGLPFVEPSFASVEPTQLMRNDINATDVCLVHGVLYELTEKDFVTICRTEGVPFAYQLHRCKPIPYTGDGKYAGRYALENELHSQQKQENATMNTNAHQEVDMISTTTSRLAFTLRAKPLPGSVQNIPPSQEYMNVLIRGAKEFAIDDDYVQKLKQIKVGRTLFGKGTAEKMLLAAERRNKWKL